MFLRYRINTFLDNVDVGEYYVHGDLETYSCKTTTAAMQSWHACGHILPVTPQ